MARINITDVKEFGKRAIDKAYTLEKHKLCSKRLSVVELTNRYSTYEDIVRKSQELFNVKVFRNASCIAEGIYIVGRENCVDQYRKWIEMIIVRVDKDTWQYGNPLHTKTHGNSAYAQYASKKAKKILQTVFELIKYRNSLFAPNIALYQKYISDEILTALYCKELYVLKNKTKYNGNIRYII